MANYILVHGGNVSADTWNDLTERSDFPAGENLGGRVWDAIAAKLESQGHRVFAPTLPDEYTYGLSDCILQIRTLIAKHALDHVILVGHSYGGMIITGVANALHDRTAALVYVDAALPESGESLFDLLQQGGWDAADVVGGHPMAYTEKLEFDVTRLRLLKKYYVFCTESDFVGLHSLVKRRMDADKQGWGDMELPTSHIPMATMPRELAQYLLDIASSGVEEV